MTQARTTFIAATALALSMGVANEARAGWSDWSFPNVFGAGPAEASAPEDGGIALPSEPRTASLPDAPEPDLLSLRLSASTTNMAVTDPGADLNDYGLDCEAALALAPGDGNTVSLSISAPCYPNSAASIEHDGLAFSVRLDEAGELDLAVPALSQDASFALMLPDGARTTSRIALETPGPARIALQSGSEIDLRSGDDGQSVIRLGDASIPGGALLQVFTYSEQDAPAVTIDAEITLASCGRRLSALAALKDNGADAAEPARVTLTMPGCDAVGDLLVMPVPAPVTDAAEREVAEAG
ncbi:hypothetical protein [Tropicimonas sp. IMCC34011]|uniref:hypothetical protein n=1 Tax=Tropicimonas sp. IMCC34011 TaxID=2248759 RepID=UPI000E280C75|nr:hypothetical protein [Tropicimonas sp. IMCC34011]